MLAIITVLCIGSLSSLSILFHPVATLPAGLLDAKNNVYLIMAVLFRYPVNQTSTQGPIQAQIESK